MVSARAATHRLIAIMMARATLRALQAPLQCRIRLTAAQAHGTVGIIQVPRAARWAAHGCPAIQDPRPTVAVMMGIVTHMRIILFLWRAAAFRAAWFLMALPPEASSALVALSTHAIPPQPSPLIQIFRRAVQLPPLLARCTAGEATIAGILRRSLVVPALLVASAIQAFA